MYKYCIISLDILTNAKKGILSEERSFKVKNTYINK